MTIQSHVDPKGIERYLESYDQSLIHEELLGATTSQASEEKDTFPILFFAAERNSPEILNVLCERGADVDGRAEPSGLPLLAYTILSAERNLSDTTNTLIALLAMGANSSDVPRDMWSDYDARPKNAGPKESQAKDASTEWCTAEIRDQLVRTLTSLPLASSGMTISKTEAKNSRGKHNSKSFTSYGSRLSRVNSGPLWQEDWQMSCRFYPSTKGDKLLRPTNPCAVSGRKFASI